MAAPDMDVIKDIPGYKVILKAVLKTQIQQLVEQLASHTDEESVILTASVSDGTLSHLGSDSGKNFLDDHEDIKSQFLGFCLKRHHRKKQQEREKQERQEAMRNVPTTPPRYGGPGPRHGFNPNRPQRFSAPRFSSPRHQGVHPVTLSRASPGSHIRPPGMRHEPYPMTRPRRPLNYEQGKTNSGTSPSAMKLPLGNTVDGQVIKIEVDDSENLDPSNQSVGESNNQMSSEVSAGATSSSVPSSSEPSSPSHIPTTATEESQVKSEMSEKDDDAKSESSTSTIPNDASDLKFSDTAPPEGLSLDSDLSNLISSDQVAKTSSATESPHDSNSEVDPNLNVKVEAITESEMELEITGVEPGRMPLMGSGSQDNWVPDIQSGMGYDPTGATGNQGDLQGSQPGYTIMSRKQDFECRPCGKYFSTCYRLKQHTQICRKDEQGTKCSFCNKNYSDRFTRRRHEETIHRGIKKNVCGTCYCRFTNRADLIGHIRFHHPKQMQKLACPTCGKTFAYQSSFQNHVAICGSARKLYKCPQCPRVFKTERYVSKHCSFKHQNHTYVCESCGETFGYKSAYARHLAKVHKS